MKKITWTLLLGLVFILTSCSDDFEERVQIRVRNVGQFNYENVVIAINKTFQSKLHEGMWSAVEKLEAMCLERKLWPTNFLAV